MSCTDDVTKGITKHIHQLHNIGIKQTRNFACPEMSDNVLLLLLNFKVAHNNAFSSFGVKSGTFLLLPFLLKVFSHK